MVLLVVAMTWSLAFGWRRVAADSGPAKSSVATTAATSLSAAASPALVGSPSATATQSGAGAAATDNAGQQPASAVDSLVKLAKAFQEFISGLLTSITELVKSIGWAIATLAILYLFRDKFKEILETVRKAIESRSFTFDVAGLKLTLTERIEPAEEATVLLSRSSFEIEEDSVPDPAANFGQVAAQREFPVSDDVARFWVHRGEGLSAARAMRQARADLEAACAKTPNMPAVRTALETFTRTLEAARFLEAQSFLTF